MTMLSTNTVAKPHLGSGLSGHYMASSQRRATVDVTASAGQYTTDTQQRSNSLGADGSVTFSDSNAAAASAFALAASTAMSATTSSAVTTAAAAFAAMAAATAPGSGALAHMAAEPRSSSLPLMHPAGMQSTGSYRQTDNGGSPLVAPRPVPAQQMMPPSWMLAALPLEMLLGMSGASHKQKIINDVFFTPEERHESPQLTPVSDADDVRPRLPGMPSDGLEDMDPSADLALFADLQGGEGRSVWGEIDTACTLSPRQPSPAATVTSDYEDAPAIKAPASADGRSLLSAHVAQAKSQYACGDSDTVSLSGESCVDTAGPVATRESLRPTIFEELSQNGVDWCRYCGTTEGINWRPGPWGKRTLCNKHGCDYKGYGFASKMPRLNLKSFADESLDERIRPVLQTFCQMCQQDFSHCDNILVHCDGCHRAYHQACHPDGIASADVSFDSPWYCELSCRDNARRRRILVELPKCRLPYMCSPRHAQAGHASHDLSLRTATNSPAPRSTRTRKRKAVCASPEPLQGIDAMPVDPNKVRKSSRVVRPSVKCLESSSSHTI
ncbi:hypothetical protein IWW40_000468 [Coemansia sp. RSA 1250]|nr:hypothetical protein IWW40_000468 [Coemansia sp. RSA 1250]